MTLSMLAEKFLMVKEAQRCGENTLHDYRVQVRKEDFVRSQHAEFSPARSLMQSRKRKL